MTKLERVAKALDEMSVGACGVKWNVVVWRVAENGWVVGVEGVRKDGYVHDRRSVLDWFCWKLKIHTARSGPQIAQTA